MLKGHIDDFVASYGQPPDSLTADAGYGSEENYLYLEELEITPYVKYGYFDKEQTEEKNKDRKNHKQKHPFHADKLPYNDKTDTYTCPMGQKMRYIGNKSRRTKTGYLQTYRRYKAQNCTGCPLRGPCHRSSGERVIERSPHLLRVKQRVKELLNSDAGREKRKQRWQVEAVFGNLKQNKGFRRFNLRGINKTTTEFGLIALAHNLQRFSTGH